MFKVTRRILHRKRTNEGSPDEVHPPDDGICLTNIICAAANHKLTNMSVGATADSNGSCRVFIDDPGTLCPLSSNCCSATVLPLVQGATKIFHHRPRLRHRKFQPVVAPVFLFITVMTGYFSWKLRPLVERRPLFCRFFKFATLFSSSLSSVDAGATKRILFYFGPVL